MILSELKFSGFRNLVAGGISLAPGLNLVTGDNGAGKSGLLEAIHIVANGKSFRSSRLTSTLQWDADTLLLRASWLPVKESKDAAQPTHQRARLSSFGLQGRESRITVNGQESSRLDLVRQFPILFIGAESLRFFEDGPKFRRQQLDWGAFHVEPRYLAYWQRYRRALAQRNRLLRDQRDASHDEAAYLPWEREMADAAIPIEQTRRKLFSALADHYGALADALGLAPGLTLNYRCGWNAETALEEQLQAARAQDLRLGYTAVGPHRDDLGVKSKGRSALNALSRGQQKSFMIAFQLALQAVVAARSEDEPLVLLDDLGAELDHGHQSRVLSHLDGLSSQCVVTTVALHHEVELPETTQRFHVEQGLISR